MTLLRSYLFPLLQVVGFVGVTVCSLWYGGWYSQGQKEYIEYVNTLDITNKPKVIEATFWNVVNHNYMEFSKPVPYIGLVLILGCFGTLGGFSNQYKINKDNELDSKLREEKENHSETQRNYYEAIGYIIRLIFVSTNDDYGDDCRVTLYRHTNDGFFKKIYRHASHTRFEHNGRLLIPENEGIVGAAWLNNGVAILSINHKFGSKRYKDQLEKGLKEHGAESPQCTTRMPTKCYFAMAIRDSDRNKMAVIALESTSYDAFSREKLEKIIQQENSDLAKYIIHKGKLDEVLNPDAGAENA